MKEGPLNADWAEEASNVSAFALSGDRIAVLEEGTLYVKEGPLNADWAEEASNVSAFALT